VKFINRHVGCQQRSWRTLRRPNSLISQPRQIRLTRRLRIHGLAWTLSVYFQTALPKRSCMIIEGLVTSMDSAHHLNLAPMGPIVVGKFDALILRPFQPSVTFRNLSALRAGVFHIIDQVDIIARAVTGELSQLPSTEPARKVPGRVLSDCCRWFEFTIDSVDASSLRSHMPATIVHREEKRPFEGFNRARHAVLEAAILATRLHLIPRQEIVGALQFLQPAVEKTGGQAELEAWQRIVDFIHSRQEQPA